MKALLTQKDYCTRYSELPDQACRLSFHCSHAVRPKSGSECIFRKPLFLMIKECCTGDIEGLEVVRDPYQCKLLKYSVNAPSNYRNAKTQFGL